MKPTIILFVKQLSFAKQYFNSILTALSDKHEIIILHTNALEKVSSTNSIFTSKDISYWSHWKLKKFIKETTPKTCIVTNIRSLLDIYFFSVCNSSDVQLTYIEHGLTLSKINKFKAKKNFHTIFKYAFYVLKTFQFIISSRTPVSSTKIIFKAFLKSNYSELELNNALLYAPGSKCVLDKLFNLTKTSIKYSGSPIVNKDAEFNNLKKTVTKKQAVYIHQPLIIDNFSELSINEEIKLIRELNDFFNKRGYDFIVKLHPRDDIQLYKNELSKTCIAELEVNIHQIIADSEIVLGHFSTALLTAVLLRKKLLILDYWEINNNSVALFKHVGIIIPNKQSISMIFDKKYDPNQEELESFVSFYIGNQNSEESRSKKLIKLINKNVNT